MAKDQEGMFDTDDANGAALETETPSFALDVYKDQPDFTPEDVYIPRLRLAQGLSQEVTDGVARAGQWLIKNFENADTALIVPLLFARKRELRDSESRLVLCSAPDGETGIGEPGGACEDCPLRHWTDNPDGKNFAPKCSFMYSYIVYSETHDTIATLSFSKSAINVGKMLNTSVAHFGLGKVAIMLTAAKKDGDRGPYYVPVVAVVHDPPEGVFKNAQAALSQQR